jgi:hypothetical protein
MNKQIRSYDELVKERQRLEHLLQAQKEIIYYDVQEIKEKLQPVKSVVEFIGMITTKDRTNLLWTLGSDIAINAIVKRFILSKAGWFLRTVIPFYLKNYSSHIIAEQKNKWLHKLKTWLSHSNGKTHKAEAETGS